MEGSDFTPILALIHKWNEKFIAEVESFDNYIGSIRSTWRKLKRLRWYQIKTQELTQEVKTRLKSDNISPRELYQDDVEGIEQVNTLEDMFHLLSYLNKTYLLEVLYAKLYILEKMQEANRAKN